MAEYKKVKYYYDTELAILLAGKIKAVHPGFHSEDFIARLGPALDPLELKARVELFADALREFLPPDYPEALGILLQILGPENQNETGMFTEGYWLMPVAFFVEKYGTGHFEESVAAIKEITKRHTGEFAIRPFIVQYPEEMLAVMEEWSRSGNVHVRRLASEGLRPRLPWAKKLELSATRPELVLPVLENLKEDGAKFVQKSVANCLNDILKDNREVAMGTLRNWAKSKDRNTKWVVKHALRNLLKKKDPEALELVYGIRR